MGALLHRTQANSLELVVRQNRWRPQGVKTGVNPGDHHPPENQRMNFIHHDCVQFGKQHSQYKAILSSIVLSRQCCEVYFISLTVGNP